jgi:hypothetical protein
MRFGGRWTWIATLQYSLPVIAGVAPHGVAAGDNSKRRYTTAVERAPVIWKRCRVGKAKRAHQTPRLLAAANPNIQMRNKRNLR